MNDPLILIVDDAKFARNLILHALESGGYQNTLQATTAAEALELFAQNEPDLVLLDITLPDSNDLSLLTEMLRQKPGAKIVMNSAMGQDIIIADALKAGARDFVVKPFDEKTFLEVISNVLAQE